MLPYHPSTTHRFWTNILTGPDPNKGAGPHPCTPVGTPKSADVAYLGEGDRIIKDECIQMMDRKVAPATQAVGNFE